jgi:CobQ-like glutamine amidotransferase family enzyme/UDP-N-acetylmuramyl tripeptide synthase
MRGVRDRGAGVAGARSRVAAAATVAVSGVSRRLGLGGGSVIGGRVGMAIDPGLLGSLATGVRCALVSGTNGKTTTTRMLTAALGGPSEVATSRAGSNLPAGIAAALAGAPGRKTAVLEVDEGYLPKVSASVSPDVLVLLNLSRDQLDRVNEVRMIAQRWREAVASTPAATIVANADDPLVVWAVGPAQSNVRFVAAGGLWHDDAKGCPACGGRIVFGEAGEWSCVCGFRRPVPYATLREQGLEIEGRTVLPVDLALPARCNRANAAMAAIAAGVLGIDEAEAIAAMAGLTEVEGRFASVHHDGVCARLLLAKNPAGWAELLDLLEPSELPVVVGINARVADGHDPSWLWDVAFERLASRILVATGERAADLGVRLKYAEVPHSVVREQTEALSAAGSPEVDYVGNYTAFQQLRRAVTGTPKEDGRRAANVRLIAPPPRRPSRSGESALRIAVVYPDLLGTYGDGGNGLVLYRRAIWRGWPAELVLAGSDKPLPTADIYCIGGGEDAPQVEAANLLSESVLSRAVENGAAVLAVCAGFQVVGEQFPDASGSPHEGVGLLSVRTQKGASARAVGEIVSDPVIAQIAGVTLGRFTGFENHSGLTRLGEGVGPLGTVRFGVGNGDGSRTEGAISGRVVGTYLHGPVLARNPALADAIFSLVTATVPEALDDEEEEALRLERFAAISGTGDSAARGRFGPIHRLVRVRRT